jgi:hypothetical protein
MNATCIKCVGFAIPPLENTFKAQLTILSLGGFIYFEFSKVFAMPLKHIKTSCLKPLSIYNTFIQGDDKYFNRALIIYFNEQD